MQCNMFDTTSGTYNDLMPGMHTQTGVCRVSVDYKDETCPTQTGIKYDSDKLQYGLLPTKSLESIVDVLTFGAKKYAPDNWKYVPNYERRYFDAMQRHLWAWKSGEKDDPESGKNHLAHAACCLMFLLEKEHFSEKDWLTYIHKKMNC